MKARLGLVNDRNRLELSKFRKYQRPDLIIRLLFRQKIRAAGIADVRSRVGSANVPKYQLADRISRLKVLYNVQYERMQL